MTTQCGAPTTDGTPCQNPATDGTSCWIQSHGGTKTLEGRPPKLRGDERRQGIVLRAVSDGLKVEDQASRAGIHPDTLRRALCCIDTPRIGAITSEDPCDFCESYAQARAEGARRVLGECRPEFRAAASFGYSKQVRVEHGGEVGVEGLVEALQDGFADREEE